MPQQRVPPAQGAGGLAGSEGCSVKGRLCSGPRKGCQGLLIRSQGSCWSETTSDTWSQSQSCYLWPLKQRRLNSRLHLEEGQMDNNPFAKAS